MVTQALPIVLSYIYIITIYGNVLGDYLNIFVL